jgi:hypothetical protein
MIELAPGGAIRFIAAPDGKTECLGGLRLEVADVETACTAAAAHGCKVAGNAFTLAGVHFRLQPVR